jgi:predicted enzyme related to lactoylglutathione lyase
VPSETKEREGHKPRVVHFEIHATDPERLIDFYVSLFGWSFTKAEGMDYWLIGTGPADEPGIDGGLVKRPVPGPVDSPALNAFPCTVQVDSVDGTLAKAGELGGAVALPKMPVGGVGWLAYIKDPDGNILGLLEPDLAAA